MRKMKNWPKSWGEVYTLSLYVLHHRNPSYHYYHKLKSDQIRSARTSQDRWTHSDVFWCTSILYEYNTDLRNKLTSLNLDQFTFSYNSVKEGCHVPELKAVMRSKMLQFLNWQAIPMWHFVSSVPEKLVQHLTFLSQWIKSIEEQPTHQSLVIWQDSIHFQMYSLRVTYENIEKIELKFLSHMTSFNLFQMYSLFVFSGSELFPVICFFCHHWTL